MMRGLHGYREAAEARPHLENHALARTGDREGGGDHGDTEGGLRALLPVLIRHHCPQGYRATEQRSPGGLPKEPGSCHQNIGGKNEVGNSKEGFSHRLSHICSLHRQAQVRPTKVHSTQPPAK